VTDYLSLLHEFTAHSQPHQIFVKMGPQKIQRKTIMGDGKSTHSQLHQIFVKMGVK